MDNYETLGEIKDDLNKWKSILHSGIRILNPKTAIPLTDLEIKYNSNQNPHNVFVVINKLNEIQKDLE